MSGMNMPDALPPDALPPAPGTLAAARALPALGPALRHALRDGVGRVVLRVEDVAPHRRRVARALLQEGALAAGGQVLEGPSGDLLLVGAEARRAERLRGLLERLVGPEGTLLWSLEHDGAAILAYAAGQGAPPPRPASPGPPLAGLDGFLDSLPLDRVVRRLVGAQPGAPPAFLRLEPARDAVAEALGQLGADGDLVDHAERRLTLRMLAALADPREARALVGDARAPRLHLPLPAGAATGRHPPGLVVATLPFALAADPDALAARMARLAEAGIEAELQGLDATLLQLVDLAALPPVRLRVAFSAALCGIAGRQLAGIAPGRVALAGAGGAQARDLAAALGLALEEPA
jgi:hypothetical protein